MILFPTYLASRLSSCLLLSLVSNPVVTRKHEESSYLAYDIQKFVDAAGIGLVFVPSTFWIASWNWGSENAAIRSQALGALYPGMRRSQMPVMLWELYGPPPDCTCRALLKSRNMVSGAV
jgi:hypothetical protein